MPAADTDSGRFAVHRASPRGFEQAYVHEGAGGAGPLLLVHGWPETKRVWWRVIRPLVDAGFEVIAPDLRGFGDSDAGPPGDDFGDVATHSIDVHALVTEHLGHERAVLVGGDLGGPVIQDLALRFPTFAERMVLFNSPLPYEADAMAGMRTRPPMEAADYFLRQGTDADGVLADLATPEARRRYIATFYSSRFWAHPGSFDPGAVDFHTEPFADASSLRASFRTYESVFDPDKRSAAPMLAVNPDVRCLILFGPSDHVIYPDFDRMAAVVFPDHVGPSCCETAATSSRGRLRMPSSPPSDPSPATSSSNPPKGVSLQSMATLSFEGETHGELVQKVRRWLASLEGEEEGHLSPVEAIQQGAEITKEALRIIASSAPEPIAQSEVVKSLTGAGYKVTDTVRKSLIDGLDSMGEMTGGGVVKTARDARKSVVYEMNSAVARQILKALRPR